MNANFTIKSHRHLEEIAPQEWEPLQDPHFPFSDYHFLRTLEITHCVGKGTGWDPHYLTVWQKQRLVGATYLYFKSHSYGEFIFDFDWAHAFHQSGVYYYPKLISAVPFTPATGPKLLTHPSQDQAAIRQVLVDASLKLAKERNLSSLHFLFIPESEIPNYETQGFAIRHSTQNHWQNRNFENFQDYLDALKRKRRQQVLKEIREVAKLPVELYQLQGEEIQEDHLRAMIKFYQSTFEKKYSYPYLNPEFFFEYHRRQPSALVLNLAKLEDNWIAGAINFTKGKNLYGRYWGATQEIPFVHFEICYYQNIRYAIDHGLQRFEAGAGGGHKMYRGLSQELTFSSHWFRDPTWRDAVGRYIQEEKRQIAASMTWAKEHSPYR